MAALGIDEDWAKADPAGLFAAGYRFVIGYVSEDNTGKNITRAQVDAAHAAGLAVGLVYEYSTTSALGGAAQGSRDAAVAVAHARQLGAPAGVALYAAIDFKATAAQMPTVLAYAQAFQAACAAAGYRSGPYAEYDVCAYLAQHGYTGLLWQTYAWSGVPPRWWAGDAMRQVLNGIFVAGATVDKDEALVDDWGQWEVDDMTPEQDQRLKDVYTWARAACTGRDSAGAVFADPWDGAPVNGVRALGDLLTAVQKLSAPAPAALTDADRADIAARVAADLGAKLDAVLAKLAAAGHALDTP